MNVWLVNPFDSLPGEDARLQRYPRLAAAFSAAGWNATLWTAGFSHVFKRERAPGAAGGPNPWRTVFVPVPPYFSNVSLARVRSHRAFAARFLTLARSKTSAGEIAAPDLIVASTPPPSAAQAALVFARETRCKTIVDIQDAWPETFARLVPLPWRAAREAAARVLFAGAFRRERAILAGAEKVSVNSLAVRDPSIIAEGARAFGSQCIVLGMDPVKSGKTPSGYEITTRGFREATGMDALEWAKRAAGLGAGEIVVNSVDADGTRAGFELQITGAIARSVGVPVVASGGAGKPADFTEVFREAAADAAIVAGMIHSGEWTIAQIKKELAESGIPVRTVW